MPFIWPFLSRKIVAVGQWVIWWVLNIFEIWAFRTKINIEFIILHFSQKIHFFTFLAEKIAAQGPWDACCGVQIFRKCTYICLFQPWQKFRTMWNRFRPRYWSLPTLLPLCLTFSGLENGGSRFLEYLLEGSMFRNCIFKIFTTIAEVSDQLRSIRTLLFNYFCLNYPFLTFSGPENGGQRSLGYLLEGRNIQKLYLWVSYDHCRKFWPSKINWDHDFHDFTLKMPSIGLILARKMAAQGLQTIF
jgi:hypothetical protein